MPQMDYDNLDDRLDCEFEAIGLSDEDLEQIISIVQDPILFMSCVLKIQDKLGRVVPLDLNSPQQRLYAEIERQEALGVPVRIIILKSRQMGFSTGVAGLFYYLTATNENITTMIIAHKADASTAIFNKNKLFFDMSPAIFQPLRKASNAKELVFENPTTNRDEKRMRPGLRSKIIIESAVNKEAGRSWTLHNLHISELAFWPYPEETMAAVKQAVPNQPGTCIIIESTANGIGGVFYEEVVKSERGESPFVLLFFPWFECEEYTMPVPKDFKADEEERDLQEQFNLTDGQLVWRRWCIQANCQGSIDKFHQEYPATVHEAFIASGRPVFDVAKIEEALRESKQPTEVGRVVEEEIKDSKGTVTDKRVMFRSLFNGYLSLFEAPVDGNEYVIGIDTAQGLEHGDFSVMEVLDQKTGKQVAEWHGHIAPDLLGIEATFLGRFYNLAWLVPEANNHGIATIDAIRKANYPRLYHRRTIDRITNRGLPEYGFLTSAKTKPMMIDGLAKYIREDAKRIKSRNALNEMLTYVFDAKGSMNAQSGCFDDRVMAFGLAVFGINQRPASGKEFKERPLAELFRINSTTGY